MRLFIPITKIDEEKREVHGTLTQEIVDRDNEIFDYDSSKPFFEKWSGYFADATGGKSVGNLRAMHRNVSAGKLTQIDFDDVAKKIDIVAKVVDDAEWAKCVEGVYTGFSAAGKVVRQWKDGTSRRYTADPYEASLADFPCVPTAMFSYVKTGGAVESRAFKKSTATTPEIEYADVDGKKLRTDTPRYTRASMAIWSVEKVRGKYDEKTQEVIGRRLRDAARRHAIVVTEKGMLRGDFAKGLYEIGELARAIDGLRWIQVSSRYERENEQDDSPVPDMLLDQVAALTDTLREMVGEECDELLEMLDYETGEFATTKVASAAGDETEFAKRVARKYVTKATAIHGHAKIITKAMADAHNAMGAVSKMVDEHCEKLAAFAGDLSGENDDSANDKSKVAGANTDEGTHMDDKKTGAAGAADAAATGATPPAAPDFAKVTADLAELRTRLDAAEKRATDAEASRDEFRKTAEELAEGVEKLIAATPRAGILRSVGKGEDVSTDGKKVEKVTGDAAADAPKTARDAFKRSFQTPQIVTGVPGGQS